MALVGGAVGPQPERVADRRHVPRVDVRRWADTGRDLRQLQASGGDCGWYSATSSLFRSSYTFALLPAVVVPLTQPALSKAAPAKETMCWLPRSGCATV